MNQTPSVKKSFAFHWTKRPYYSGFFFLLGTLTIVFNGVRPVFLLPLSDLLYFAAFGFLVLEGIIQRKKLFEIITLHPFWVPALLILFGGLLSSWQAMQPSTSILVTLKTWFLFSLWMGMGIVLARETPLGRYIVYAFLGGAAIASGVAVWDFLTGMQLGPKLYMLDQSVSGFDPAGMIRTLGRYSGTLGHPNHLGELTAVAIPIMLNLAWIALEEKARIYKVVLAAGMTGVMIWANFLTGSIAGLLGMLAALVCLVIVRWVRSGIAFRAIKRWLVWVGAALMIILLTAFLLPDNRLMNWMELNLSRAVNITGPSRWIVMQEAIVLIGNKPLTGYGMDQGNLQLPSGQWMTSDGVHNTVLQNWLGGGVLAFLGALLLYGGALVLSAQTIRAYIRRQASPLSLGLAVSIVGWALIDMTQTSIYLRYTWITVALLFGFATAKAGGWPVWLLKSANHDAADSQND